MGDCIITRRGGGIDINGFDRRSAVKHENAVQPGDFVNFNTECTLGAEEIYLSGAWNHYCAMIEFDERHIFCIYGDADRHPLMCMISHEPDGAWSASEPVELDRGMTLKEQPRLVCVRNDCVLIVYAELFGEHVWGRMVHVVPDGYGKGRHHFGPAHVWALFLHNQSGYDVCKLNDHQVCVCGNDYTGNAGVRLIETKPGDYLYEVGEITYVDGLSASAKVRRIGSRADLIYLATTDSQGNIVDYTFSLAAKKFHRIAKYGPVTFLAGGSHLLDVTGMSETTYIAHYAHALFGMYTASDVSVYAEGHGIARHQYVFRPLDGFGDFANLSRGAYVKDKYQDNLYGVMSYVSVHGVPITRIIEEKISGPSISIPDVEVQSNSTVDQANGISPVQISPTRWLMPTLCAEAYKPGVKVITVDFVPVVSKWNAWHGARPGVAITGASAGQVIETVAAGDY